MIIIYIILFLIATALFGWIPFALLCVIALIKFVKR